jgi:mannonate dehydratase
MNSRIRIGDRMSPRPSAEELAHFQQMGIEAASIWTTIDDANYDYMVATKTLLQAHGIELWNIDILDLHCDPAMVLGLPERDSKIAQYKQYLRDLGRAQIGYTTYAHMANIKMLPYYQTQIGSARGGIPTREFDMEIAKDLPLSHGREYGDTEIWETLTDFIRQVVPVAEEAGVRIGLHPDDPPVPSLGGVARVIRNAEGYQKAVELAASPNFGLCLCVGTWAEGGEMTGRDVYQMIEHYGKMDRLFKIHFRNVDARLPKFRETLVDDSFIDMYAVMKALDDVGFDGMLLPDHVPGGASQAAYTIGYLRATRDRVYGES